VEVSMTGHPGRRVLVSLLAAGCAAAGAREAAPDAPSCELVPAGRFGPAGTVKVRVETVVSGLEAPWAMAFLPGGDLLVTERPGRVRLVRRGKLVAAPVIAVEVASRSEGGLLGMALAQDFASSRRFFLYFTASEGGRDVNRLASYLLAPDGASARPEKVLLDGIPAERYHDGGRVKVGPDGLVYVGTGDAGVPPAAQRQESLSGKILRVAPDGAIPKDNPVPGSPVFAMGFRNVEAFDWRPDGALVVADHGPSGELGRRGHDRVVVATRGANLGWPDAFGCGARAGMTPPLLAFTDAAPPGGGAFYTGDAVPAWKGSFLVGTLGSRHLHRLVLDAADPNRLARHEVYLAGEPPAGLGRVRDVATGPDGALWVTTSNCDGRGTCPPEKDRIVRVLQ
jgi:glucose/arabinose dehydrogenase